jgi:hypothetical protein
MSAGCPALHEVRRDAAHRAHYGAAINLELLGESVAILGIQLIAMDRQHGIVSQV